MRDTPLQQYVAAWQAEDHATIQALLLSADDDAVLLLQRVAASLDLREEPQGSLDAEALHSALQAAGFAPGDALRLSQLALGEPAAYLRACAQAGGVTSEGLATQLVEGLPALTEGDRPAVHRYLTRVLSGRHDLRRIQDQVLDRVADACGSSRELVRSMRDAAGPPRQFAAAAARSDSAEAGEPLVIDHAGAVSDAVDDLFCGRRLDG